MFIFYLVLCYLIKRNVFHCFSASSSGSTKFEVLRQPIVRIVVEDNVIRQPRGPDNTKGFNHRS